MYRVLQRSILTEMSTGPSVELLVAVLVSATLACEKTLPPPTSDGGDSTLSGSSATTSPSTTGSGTETSPSESTGDTARDPCSAYADEVSCPTSCEWHESMLFPPGMDACSSAIPSGVCVTMANAPETGCTGTCAKFWRETPEGLQLFAAEYCFEFPVAWSWCQLFDRPECTCGCVTPP